MSDSKQVRAMKENTALVSVAIQKLPSLATAVPSAERLATAASPPKESANGSSIYIKHFPLNVTPAQVLQ